MSWRPASLVLGLALLFAATVAVLLRVMPTPLNDLDYLVAGALATLIVMAALFAILLATSRRKGG